MIKRYFDLIDKRTCAELEIVEGSMAAKAGSEEFEVYFKTPVREVDKTEYKKLVAEYEGAGIDGTRI